MICVFVEYLLRVAIEAIVEAILPEARTVFIWIGNGEERENRNATRQFHEEENDNDSWIPPFGRDEEAHCGNVGVDRYNLATGLLLWSATEDATPTLMRCQEGCGVFKEKKKKELTTWPRWGCRLLRRLEEGVSLDDLAGETPGKLDAAI